MSRATLARRPPTRSCIVCRTAREKRDLLRIVRSPEGHILYDAGGRANGRGAYLCRDETCISTAFGRGVLARSLETPVPATLRAELESAAGLDLTSPGGKLGQE